MNPLEMHGLVKRYPGFELSLDLVVPQGFVMGFVGANGSGKTTTLRCALGAAIPDAGTVTLVDKAHLGTVFDTPPYHPIWTVAQLERMMAGFYPTWDAEGFDTALRDAGIARDKRIKDLSRGMGMRLQLAVALNHGATFLMLDEPTSGLDPLARDEFLDQLRAFMTDETHTVLFSSHITSDLEKVADYVTVLDAGRVVASEPLPELLDDYRLVAGGDADLSPEASGLVLGLRRHSAGWDGLMRTEDTLALGAGASVQAPTLDDIVVRIAKEHRHG